MEQNLTIARFSYGNETKTRPLYQYNYGQVLKFELDLPTAYEVHFANAENGTSYTAIGNADGVIIPDAVFESGNDIFAWVFLHEGEGDGETVYKAIIPIIRRAQPSNDIPTPHQQTVIEEAISALNEAVEQTASDVAATEANAQRAENAKGGAVSAKNSAVSAKNAAVTAKNNAEAAANTAEQKAREAAQNAQDIEDLTVSAVTLEAGQPATVEKTHTEGQPYHLTFGIPKGERGDIGAVDPVPVEGSSNAVASGGVYSELAKKYEKPSGGIPKTDLSSTVQNSLDNADTAVAQLPNKVDKVQGKGLSENDFTDTLKEKLDGIEAQANKTVVDNALSNSSENPVQNKVVKSALDGKANTEGVYDDIISGTAKQILATVGVVEKVPYNFRTGAGAHDIGGNRETDKIIGGTVVWNQLVNDVSATVPTGHIYFAIINGVSTVAESDGTALTTDPATDNVHDLTKMFGSTIADYIYSLETDTVGAGVAWFRALFPKAYYSYNAGQLMSVKTTSHDMVGFNAYNHATGTAILLGGNEYQITGAYTALSYVDVNGDSETITPDANGKFTPTNNGTLTVTDGNDTDTCVHLVWSGSRDGEYEPYVKHSYALDPNLELRGFPKLATDNSLYYDGDEYEGSGQVTRKYGIETYNTTSVSEPSASYSNIAWYLVRKPSDSKTAADNSSRGLICSKYEFGPYVAGANRDDASLAGKIYAGFSNNYFYIGYPVGTTLEEAKADLDGMQIVYELATPTTESAAPFANPQIVDDYGTEQYVDDRAVAIPVGHETLYQANLRDKLQHLPSLYSVNGVVQSGLFHIQQDGTNMVLVPDTSDTRLNALEALVPVYEDYTIETTDWTALSSSDPYDYSATVTATHAIGTDTVVELINNNPVLFAAHGFAIGEVSGQNITIYAIGTPSASVSLEVSFHG